MIKAATMTTTARVKCEVEWTSEQMPILMCNKFTNLTGKGFLKTKSEHPNKINKQSVPVNGLCVS